MKANELKQKSVDELKQELSSLLREQFNLRMQQGVGQMTRPDQMKKVRRNIARVKTVMNQKASAAS